MALAAAAAAVFVAAFLNALAGGGSLIALPVLIWAGLPAVAANTTGTTALLFGYLGSVWNGEKSMGRRDLWRLSLPCGFGGAVGALLLICLPAKFFMLIVPALLAFATLLFALGPLLAQVTPAPSKRHLGKMLAIGLFLIGIYGGYFNGGVGILLIAFLTLAAGFELASANRLKNLASMVLTGVAVATYAIGGAVHWSWLPILAPAGLLGGWCGMELADRVNPMFLRWLIVVIGVLLTVVFGIRTWF